MRRALVIAVVLGSSVCLGANVPRIPLPSGTYRFQWKDAEFSNGPGFPVSVTITGRSIVVTNKNKHGAAPLGDLDGGVLLWHSATRQWIISDNPSDATASSVGGCGDSDPAVVDFKARIIWTCSWGP
jgi:hypothetical protein